MFIIPVEHEDVILLWRSWTDVSVMWFYFEGVEPKWVYVDVQQMTCDQKIEE